ncbi:alpha/beta hydrolase fold domain-containing protein [Deinococcus arenicola]|uniref:alpha/beta hydrolase fold domain-containing protein n=1 Tax=Deinococcus arenicola TaxID=2994950 RepID=UPI003D67FB5B
MGQSAGGGLVAALAQLAHDRAGVAPCLQVLQYSMLDNRTVLQTDHADRGGFVWTPGSNRLGWTSYLGHSLVLETAPKKGGLAGAGRSDWLCPGPTGAAVVGMPPSPPPFHFL